MNDKIELDEGSKATSLEKYQKCLKKSIVEKLYYFSVLDWKTKGKTVIQHIQDNFKNPVVVRSSSLFEDKKFYSNAGKFLSVLNIEPSNTKHLEASINDVIASYGKDEHESDLSQILIQEQLFDISVSGVVFTCEPKNDAPYYVINYDDTSHTSHSVTSGVVNKQIKIFKYIATPNLPEEWKDLITSLREIEECTHNKNLDIEFGIDSNAKVHIFQVRSLVVNFPSSFTKKTYVRTVNLLKMKHKKGTYLSNMAFWNPAEIVGEKPQYLASSLYNWIILENSWNRGISELGYTKIEHPIYISVLGRTYINVNIAFKSLIPQNIGVTLKKKLVQIYLKRLQEKPQLHDKIEFEIVPNCFYFGYATEFTKIDYSTLNTQEIGKYKAEILGQTNKLLTNWEALIAKADKICERENPKLEIDETTLNYSQKITLALDIFSECRAIDTAYFAGIARLAFISKSIFKSLLKEDIITPEEFQIISLQIKTFNTNAQYPRTKTDITKMKGHLRAGTYDITQLPYSKNSEISGTKRLKEAPHKEVISSSIINKLEKACIKNKLECNGESLLNFIITAPSKREYIKFLFTKQISFGLELIASAGEELGYSRIDLSYLDRKTLAFASSLNSVALTSLWNSVISKRHVEKSCNDLFELPDCIFDDQDYEVIKFIESKPNFITNGKITARSLFLDNKQNMYKHDNLSNKIVLIENADPGYDWLFDQQIAGLVTKYGGVASHMAIRCNEFNTPAVLGCGGELFEMLRKARFIQIDCEKESIAEASTPD